MKKILIITIIVYGIMSSVTFAKSIGEAFVYDIKNQDDYALIKDYYLELIENEIGLKTIGLSTTDVKALRKKLLKSYQDKIQEIRTALVNRDLDVSALKFVSNIEEQQKTTSKSNFYLTKNTFTLSVGDTYIILEVTLQYLPKTVNILNIGKVISYSNFNTKKYTELQSGIQDIILHINKKSANYKQLRGNEMEGLREKVPVVDGVKKFFTSKIQLTPSTETTKVTYWKALLSEFEDIQVILYKDVHPQKALLYMYEVQSLLSKGFTYTYNPKSNPLLMGTKGFDKPIPLIYAAKIHNELKKDVILNSVSRTLVLKTTPELAKKFFVTLNITEGASEGKANLELELSFY